MILNEIERAVIEKLCAGVSMPEAVDLSHPDDVSACYGYTAEQLRAYGAACRVKALEDAADTCNSTMYIDSDGSVGKYGPMTHANTEIKKCADAIRAMRGEA